MSGNKITVTAPLDEKGREVFLDAVGNENRDKVFFIEEDSPREEILSDTKVIVSFFFNREVDRSEYSLLSNAELLQTISAGVDYLPFEEIPQHIEIAANSGGWAYQIAEHSIAMAMALYKRLVPLHNRLSKGNFKREAFLLRNVSGKVFGIAGYGGIGKHAGRLAKGLGMKVYALNRSGRTEEDVDYIGTMDEMDFLLENSDILLMALPLTRHTKGMIGAEELRRMKKDGTIINVARAPLIDEKALYDHLAANPEFQAGLDVWWQEPSWSDASFSVNYPFFDLENFIGTPHNSNYVEGAMEKALNKAGQNVSAFLEGEKFAGKVEREDYLFE